MLIGTDANGRANHKIRQGSNPGSPIFATVRLAVRSFGGPLAFSALSRLG